MFAVTGEGYSLLWYEGDQDFVPHGWRHGVVYAPPDNMFHQHFNVSPAPARYLAVQMGSTRYPLFRAKVFTYDKGADTDAAEGGNQIDYADQDPRIHAMFLDELARRGIPSGMGKFIAESRGPCPARRIHDIWLRSPATGHGRHPERGDKGLIPPGCADGAVPLWSARPRCRNSEIHING